MMNRSQNRECVTGALDSIFSCIVSKRDKILVKCEIFSVSR